ncbi:hypothetical protein DPMN_010144 [Dreissena polymorpha]|uniref:Uncharacterized protein n=1 Tax=Dreissena polymorpha TaxID=45954 RepID=A0A9D4MY94_DREPO|nr:hypothetical protein DPMN_010144 [Dreissena polymorpha]
MAAFVCLVVATYVQKAYVRAKLKASSVSSKLRKVTFTRKGAYFCFNYCDAIEAKSESTSGRLCRSPNKAAQGVINLTVAANRFLDGTMLVFREDEFRESAVRYEGDIERENLRY